MNLTLLLTSYMTFPMQGIVFGFHFTEVQDEEFENMQNNKKKKNFIVKNVTVMNWHFRKE